MCRISLLLFAFITFAILEASLAEEWKSYVNVRLGFHLDYSACLKQGRMPANCARQTFSKGKFSVYTPGTFLHGHNLEHSYRNALKSPDTAIT